MSVSRKVTELNGGNYIARQKQLCCVLHDAILKTWGRGDDVKERVMRTEKRVVITWRYYRKSWVWRTTNPWICGYVIARFWCLYKALLLIILSVNMELRDCAILVAVSSLAFKNPASVKVWLRDCVIFVVISRLALKNPASMSTWFAWLFLKPWFWRIPHPWKCDYVILRFSWLYQDLLWRIQHPWVRDLRGYFSSFGFEESRIRECVITWLRLRNCGFNILALEILAHSVCKM
jgi:hypothetical protein